VTERYQQQIDDMYAQAEKSGSGTLPNA
jgi:hypothetical protein